MVNLCHHNGHLSYDEFTRQSKCSSCGAVVSLHLTPKELAEAKNVLGTKADGGKLQYWLLPNDAVAEVVRVLMFGAKKYSPGNWAKVPEARQRYYDAAMRHLTTWFDGERCDPESGLHHLAHFCCCGLFLLALDLREKK